MKLRSQIRKIYRDYTESEIQNMDKIDIIIPKSPSKKLQTKVQLLDDIELWEPLRTKC